MRLLIAAHTERNRPAAVPDVVRALATDLNLHHSGSGTSNTCVR